MRRIPFFGSSGRKIPKRKERKNLSRSRQSHCKKEDETGKTKKEENSKKSSFLFFFLLVLRALGEFGLCSDTVQGLQASSSSARGIQILQRNLLGNSSPKSTRQEFLLATGHTHTHMRGWDACCTYSMHLKY